MPLLLWSSVLNGIVLDLVFALRWKHGSTNNDVCPLTLLVTITPPPLIVVVFRLPMPIPTAAALRSSLLTKRMFKDNNPVIRLYVGIYSCLYTVTKHKTLMRLLGTQSMSLLFSSGSITLPCVWLQGLTSLSSDVLCIFFIFAQQCHH